MHSFTMLHIGGTGLYRATQLYPGLSIIQTTHVLFMVVRVIRYTWATHVLSIWLSKITWLHIWLSRVIQGYLATRGIHSYAGYTHIGYTHMCYPGYTWLSLVYTFMVTTGYRLDMENYLGYKWLFMFTTSHPGYTWLQTILKITIS